VQLPVCASPGNGIQTTEGVPVMVMKRIAPLATAVAFCAVAAYAQPSNPRGTASATVGGKKVAVDYGRPALKGRSMDDLLKQLPEDRIWRAGENQVTTLTTEGDILIGGKKVPAGKYSLYVHAPAQGDWSVAINSDLGIALGKLWDKAPDNVKNEPWPHLEGYEKNIAGKEVARAQMKSGIASPAAELFTIDMKPAGNGANMILSWGDRSWSIDVQPAK
jgi:Protein of unknown function (DUF2911)